MKKLSVLLFLCASVLMGQPLTTPVNITPDCLIFFDFTANASSASFDNRFLGCKTLYVAYTSTGFPALTLTLQDAPDNGGVPGAFVAFAGTLVEGVNPNVAVTQASTIMYGYYPWVRVTLTGAVAGAGRRIRGTLYGYRQTPVASIIFPAAATVTANQGTANTVGNRWPVYLSDGANAQGVVGNPLFARLSDGANAQGTQTNPLWDRLTDGTNPIGTATNPLRINSTTACTLSAAISLAPAAIGNQEIVALTALKSIRVCNISIANSGAADVKLVQGTGVNCVTGPANVTGTFYNVLSASLGSQLDPFSTGVAQALCLYSSAAVNIGGIVLYEKY